MPEIDRYDEAEFVDAPAEFREFWAGTSVHASKYRTAFRAFDAGFAAGQAQAEAEIADWLEGQAVAAEEKGGDWVRKAVADVEAAALREVAKAVRQGQARREGAALAAAGVAPGPEGGA